MSIILGIFDSDIEYSSQLMSYIKRKHKNITQVRIFTNKTILNDFLNHNNITVLLLSEDKIQDEIYYENIKHMCILSEGNMISEEDKKAIYKFQSAEQIVLELFDYFPELNKGERYHNSNVQIISIFSVSEIYGKDNFSYNLANQYGVVKKTLLIDCNIFHGRYQSSHINSEKGLSEFLYFLKQDSPNLLLKMNEQIQRIGNFDYLKGVKFGPDIFNLTLKELEYWTKELKGSDYEIIIFNTGWYSEVILKLLQISNQVFMVVKNNLWERKLINNFNEQLKWTGYEDIIEKLEIVEIQENLIEGINEHQIDSIFIKEWGDLVLNYARINE